MARRRPRPGKSRQRKHSGGSFASERQRRFLWANFPRAAKRWAHNRTTTKSQWRRSPKGRGGGIKTGVRRRKR
jgi:hypothetical protein